MSERIKVLTDAWLGQELEAARSQLESQPGLSVRVQVQVFDVPDRGEVAYYIIIVDGRPESGALGQDPDRDVLIRMPYEVLLSVVRDEIDEFLAEVLSGRVGLEGDITNLQVAQLVLESPAWRTVRANLLGTFEIQP